MGLRVVVWSPAIFIALAAVVPASAAAAPLEFGAAMAANWYEHSNVPGNSFNGRTIRPWIRYDGPAGNWNLDGRAEHGFQFYSGSGADSAFGSRRHADDRVRFFAQRRWTERQDLTFAGTFVRAQDLLEADPGTTLPRGDVTRWSGEIGSRVQVFDANVRLRGTRYDDDPALADSRSLGWRARVLPFRRSMDEAFVGAAGSQLDVEGTTELVSIRPSAGYRRRIVRLFTAEVEGGIAFTRFADGGTEQKPLVGFGLERDPHRGRALAFATHVRFEGDSLAAVSLEGGYPVAGGHVRLRFQSDAEGEGGYYRTASRTTEFSTTVEDTLARANVVGLQGGYAVTRPLRGDGPSTNLVRATAFATRRVQPWLDFRLVASYAHELASAFHPPVRRVRVGAELDFLASGLGDSVPGSLTGDRP